jgi:hypothetical protein
MKLIVAVVAGLILGPVATLGTLGGQARADEPVPAAPAPWDDDGPPPEAEPPAPPPADEAPVAPAPVAPAPGAPVPPRRVPGRPHRARMSSTAITPRGHFARRLEPIDEEDNRLEKQEDTVLGGRHFRVKTARGAVHVWVPPDYDRATAGTVIYVHGYYTDADGAWREYDLARQFRASHQNAMFIVPDAPSGNDDDVKWPALKDLRRAVTRANIHLPDGPVVVMGHSGAFRTVMQWVDHRLVDQIILLDALYAGEAAFDEFIASGKRADDHKLIVVAASTAEESSSFARRYKFAVAREKMPSSAGGFSRRERGAKLLYIRSQFEHMAIVTSGKVIPLLLRVTPLKAL